MQSDYNCGRKDRGKEMGNSRMLRELNFVKKLTAAHYPMDALTYVWAVLLYGLMKKSPVLCLFSRDERVMHLRKK